MTIVHPYITQEIIAIKGVFHSRMNIQYSLANVKITIDITIDSIVCGTAQGIDPVQVVDSAPAIIDQRLPKRLTEELRIHFEAYTAERDELAMLLEGS